MKKKYTSIHALMLLAFVAFAGQALAADGLIEINQVRAEAGGVTAGDTPGFPVVISVPGSYRLTGNLTVQDANTNAIAITADNVSIDLNGFSIAGPNVCSQDASTLQVTCLANGGGEGVEAPHSNIEVRNGLIRGFGSTGISALSGRFSELRVSHNGGIGVQLEGGTLSRVVSETNGGTGIHMDSGTITESGASKNGLHGFLLSRVNVIGVLATRNRSTGIGTGPGSIVAKAIVTNNGKDGIFVHKGIVGSSVIASNRDSGIVCVESGLVFDSSIYENFAFGLDPQGNAAVAYRGNTIGVHASGAVGPGGTQLGLNLCGNSLCP